MKDVSRISEIEDVIDSSEGRNVVIVFGAEWCEPYRRIERFLEDCERSHRDTSVFCRCDADTVESAVLDVYRFTVIPTVFVVSDGMITARLSGSEAARGIHSFIDNC